MIQDGTLPYVEPAEGDGAEVGGPDIVVDLFEADEVAAEQVADVDPLRSPSDPAVGRDLPDLEVSGILGRLELVGKLSIRGLIDRGGRLLAESLVRPDLVEVVSEDVEASLLGGAVGGGREGGFRLEIPVHAFVSTVLVRGSGLDEVGEDVELDPPDGEAREAAQGNGCEGGSVVGPDPVGEAELLEEPSEDAPGAGVSGTREALACEQEPAKAVLDGERIAVDAVEGLEVPLEIGGPDGVGGIKRRRGRTRVGLLAFPALLRDELLAEEVFVKGLGRRERPIGVERLEVADDLASPPAGTSFSELDRSLEDMRLGGVRTGFRPVRTVGQPLHAIGRVPVEPFVACLPADVVAPAELGEGEEATLRLEDESLSFSHGISLEPWHRRLPRNRKRSHTLRVATVTHQG
jgi:hypothetical protein